MLNGRTTGVSATLKYKFCPKMDAVMATQVIATVKIVSACRQIVAVFCQDSHRNELF